MPYVTRLTDQKTGKSHILLLRRLLPKGTILSDGVNVARFRVARRPTFVGTFGRDFALEGGNLAEVIGDG
jgi:hypothetical protein